jgi:hypothetical protein
MFGFDTNQEDIGGNTVSCHGEGTHKRVFIISNNSSRNVARVRGFGKCSRGHEEFALCPDLSEFAKHRRS